MNIKFNSDDILPHALKKTVEIAIMIITVKATFLENNKYSLQVYLDQCLYKL